MRSTVIARILRSVAVVAAALLGAVVGVLAFVVAARTGLSPRRNPGLAPQVTVSFAIIGSAVGTVGWALARRRARRPRRVVTMGVVALVVVALGADVVAAATIGAPGALLTAAVHVVVIALVVGTLSRVLPLSARRDVPPADHVLVEPWPRRLAAVALLLVAAAWVLVNKSVEGPTLLVVTRHHGLTAADLFSLAAVLTAIALLRSPPGGSGVTASAVRRPPRPG